jgi:ParB-like chromosome segregation protein Spo0J
MDTIKASLARFGQQTPIVVDANGIIRKGNGTHQAAKALGWETIGIVRTSLKGAEATSYAIADNRTAELAEWDGTALAETLKALQSEEDEGIFEAAGFSTQELDDICSKLGDGVLGDEANGGAELPEPGESNYKEQFGVIVICPDEAVQQSTYEALERLGYNCRVVTT